MPELGRLKSPAERFVVRLVLVSIFVVTVVSAQMTTGRLEGALGGLLLASLADYADGLVFGRELLVTGLAQGPTLVAATVRGSPEGGNRAQYVANWNFRVSRDFRLPSSNLAAAVDVMNVTDAGHSIEQSDVTDPNFNLRLPVAIQPARFVRMEMRFDF